MGNRTEASQGSQGGRRTNRRARELGLPGGIQPRGLDDRGGSARRAKDRYRRGGKPHRKTGFDDTGLFGRGGNCRLCSSGKVRRLRPAGHARGEAEDAGQGHGEPGHGRSGEDGRNSLGRGDNEDGRSCLQGRTHRFLRAARVQANRNIQAFSGRSGIRYSQSRGPAPGVAGEAFILKSPIGDQ